MHPDTIALAVLRDKLARISGEYEKRARIWRGEVYLKATPERLCMAEVAQDISDTLKGLAKE